MASVLIVAGGTGRAASRASVLAIAVAAPTAVFEAVVGVGVTGIAAKAARCASAMLGIRVVMNRNQLCKVLSPKSSKTEQIALFRCA